MTARLRPAPSSFSLVEVVLAMGIVSFSVLAIVGLLSTANDTNRRAREEGSAARIAANEFERLRSLNSSSGFWSATPGTLPDYPTRYYDGDLKDLGANSTGAIYKLDIDFSNAPVGTADVLLEAKVHYPAQAPAANQNVYRFTALMNNPL